MTSGYEQGLAAAAGQGDVVALPLQELVGRLGISEETAVLMGMERCARLASVMDNLAHVNDLSRLEPPSFDAEPLRTNEIEDSSVITAADKLANAIETYDRQEQTILRNANVGGKVTPKSLRSRFTTRDTISRSVPRLGQSVLPADLGATVMEDAAHIRDIIDSGMVCIGALPVPVLTLSDERRIQQLDAVADHLAGLQIVSPNVIKRLAGLLRAERVASAVEIIAMVEPDSESLMLPDAAVAVWTNQTYTWLEAKQVARSYKEYTESEQEITADIAIIEMPPIDVPVNETYRPTDKVQADQDKVTKLNSYNDELHRMTGDIMATYKGMCGDVAVSLLGTLTAEVYAGLQAVESQMEEAMNVEPDMNASPYNLLPRSPSGEVDPRHTRFIQQCEHGVLPRLRTIREELDGILERALHAWPDSMRKIVVEAPQVLHEESAKEHLPRKDAINLVRAMANTLEQTAATQVNRVISGKPTKKTKSDAAAGNPAACEEMRIRGELRTCGFDPMAIGAVVAIINGDWEPVIADQTSVANRYHQLALLAESIDSPGLLRSHSLQSVVNHDFGRTLSSVQTYIERARDNINVALNGPQLMVVRQVLRDYLPNAATLPARELQRV